jgi:hypothetical protein
MSKREWVLLILIIVIGEYVFLDKVFKYGADSAVLNYMSFAGTLVSIILAVLAIVYTYYQNFSQQRDSGNIASQIDLLRSTVSEVRVSKGEFAKELKRIDEIGDKLDQSISLISESKTHVSSLSEHMEKLTNSYAPKSLGISPVSSSITLSDDQVREYLYRLPETSRVAAYALFISKDVSLGFNARATRYYIQPMLNHAASSMGKIVMGQKQIDFYTGFFHATYFGLSIVNIVSISSGVVRFHETAKHYFLKWAEEEASLSNDALRELVNFMNQAASQAAPSSAPAVSESSTS